jgi:hypothetical protein
VLELPVELPTMQPVTKRLASNVFMAAYSATAGPPQLARF